MAKIGRPLKPDKKIMVALKLAPETLEMRENLAAHLGVTKVAVVKKG